MSFRIRLEKENCKFSASHFTIFGPDRAERLHGHNYYVTCDVVLKSVEVDTGMAFDFNQLKPLLRQVADALDEFILIPSRSPYLKVTQSEGSITVQFANKIYQLPTADVVLLPIVNVTSEQLARYLAEQVVTHIRALSTVGHIDAISLGVQETRGQSVFFEMKV